MVFVGYIADNEQPVRVRWVVWVLVDRRSLVCVWWFGMIFVERASQTKSVALAF